jgi:hypothetical protein
LIALRASRSSQTAQPALVYIHRGMREDSARRFSFASYKIAIRVGRAI